jgi:hypothetical protein
VSPIGADGRSAAARARPCRTHGRRTRRHRCWPRARGSLRRMSDRRYSTARWQRLRKAVLAHYGYVCQLEGPRCTGYATTVHHLIPSSQGAAPVLGAREPRRRLLALQLRRRRARRSPKHTADDRASSRPRRRAAAADRADGREARTLRERPLARSGPESAGAADLLARPGVFLPCYAKTARGGKFF